jgi:hypothetical protein
MKREKPLRRDHEPREGEIPKGGGGCVGMGRLAFGRSGSFGGVMIVNQNVLMRWKHDGCEVNRTAGKGKQGERDCDEVVSS